MPHRGPVATSELPFVSGFYVSRPVQRFNAASSVPIGDPDHPGRSEQRRRGR